MTELLADSARTPSDKPKEGTPTSPAADVTTPNSMLAHALDGSGAANSVRSRVAAVTGYDLAGVTVHEDSHVASRAGVQGVASGLDVHLAPGIAPGSSQGEHVLAHELAHVVQQGSSRSDGLDAIPGRRGALESDADAIASAARDVTSRPGALDALRVPRELAVQHYDPRYHRTSLTGALEGSGFTADEIGKIYASNWERDLSQAHPSLGAVILAWKAAKVAAWEGFLGEREISGFQFACTGVLEAALSGHLMGDSSYGGYAFWEHMDNPAGTDNAPEMKAALNGKNKSGLPDHMYISREYIKESLFEATRLSHPDLAKESTAGVAAASAATRSYAAGPVKDGKPEHDLRHGDTPSSVGQVAPDIVGKETSLSIQQKKGLASGGGAKLDPKAYEHLGRASHALEDFWSHSNFVERAIGQPEFMLGGLTTSTFLTDDKVHALAHKIRGIADEIAAERPLVDVMAGRRHEKLNKSEVTIGDESPVQEDDFAAREAHIAEEKAKDEADPSRVEEREEHSQENASRGFWRGLAKGWASSPGSLWDRAKGAVWGGVKGWAVAKLADLAGTDSGVLVLRKAAELLDKGTELYQEAAAEDDKSKYAAHGLLAKDQPGHEDDFEGHLKTAKFELSHALSTAADARVIGKMKSVIDAPSAHEANARLQGVYKDLDALIADATPGHPLWSLVLTYRKGAENVLNKWLGTPKAKEATRKPARKSGGRGR